MFIFQYCFELLSVREDSLSEGGMAHLCLPENYRVCVPVCACMEKDCHPGYGASVFAPKCIQYSIAAQKQWQNKYVFSSSREYL